MMPPPPPSPAKDRHSVLVVEDDAATRTLVGTLMERAGFETKLVPTAADALEILKRRDFDVAIVDLLMPGLDGRHIVNQLEKTNPHFLPRIIILTATSPAHVERLEIRKKVGAVIHKPFDVSELVLAVSQCVQSRPPMAEL